MNWEAIGAVGEVFGALLVGLSLAYLAIQVRLTRRVWIRQNERDLVAHYVNNCGIFATDPDLARIHLRAMEDTIQLTEEERMRWHMFLWPFLVGIQEGVADKEMGIFDSENIDIFSEGAANVLRTPGGRSWWETNSHLYRPAFRAYMQKQIESGTVTGLDIPKY